MNRYISTLVLVAIVLLAGCTGSSTPTPTSNLEGVVELHNNVYFSGTTTVSNGSFVMRGQVVGCFGHVGPEECRNTRVLLYTENGSLIASEYVGTLHGRRNVSLETDRLPQYVILASPDFWNANHTTVGYRFYSHGHYLGKPIEEREELPVDVRTPTPGTESLISPRHVPMQWQSVGIKYRCQWT